MIEDFLHYIWLYKKFDVLHITTTQQEPLDILSAGYHNLNSGPDFFNGLLRIGEQVWAGNIEIHIRSSDWYHHNHEMDAAYDNVILHVVYDHDTDIFRKDNSVIPTLELKNYICKDLLVAYYRLFSKHEQWINCDYGIAEVPEFALKHWLERLYFERLEQKSNTIDVFLITTKQDWEAVLFRLLAKNFGLKVNSEAFLSMAQSFEFSIVRKVQSDSQLLEALLLGQSGVLEKEKINPYYKKLQKDYRFLKQKFQLNNQGVETSRFFRLRPPNFPTIRLSQLANLYYKEPNLFSKVILIEELSEFYELFKVSASMFWKTHYSFDKESKASHKYLTTPFIDLLLINTILPLKFYYAKQKGDVNHENLIKIISAIHSEKNSIIKGFDRLGVYSDSAMHSQALIQLKTNYCDKNKCLKCVIGNTLLNK
ncbi:Protein of unknown function [Formosa sp. Hel1_31_208]|uniref:DUF2851 family protein n=1 Tax=Formosa sp. Hel1_31_208 TaxID=1798225 RepID=UPI00087D9939|nr:DUF2851 family protein [Formosa sp. Hel1_31_208]SDR98817.1 Protein of unknown function [Formosa sp. Hel1_31_208]